MRLHVVYAGLITLLALAMHSSASLLSSLLDPSVETASRLSSLSHTLGTVHTVAGSHPTIDSLKEQLEKTKRAFGSIEDVRTILTRPSLLYLESTAALFQPYFSKGFHELEQRIASIREQNERLTDVVKSNKHVYLRELHAKQSLVAERQSSISSALTLRSHELESYLQAVIAVSRAAHNDVVSEINERLRELTDNARALRRTRSDSISSYAASNDMIGARQCLEHADLFSSCFDLFNSRDEAISQLMDANRALDEAEVRTLKLLTSLERTGDQDLRTQLEPATAFLTETVPLLAQARADLTPLLLSAVEYTQAVADISLWDYHSEL